MKKLLTAFLIVCSISAFAQKHGQNMRNLSDEELAERQTKMLAMQLDLNEDQQESIQTLFTERIQSRRERKEEMKEMNEKQKAELREILTPEQYEKWEGLMEKRRKGLKQRMKRRGN